jgi:hypothetical protein
VLLGKALSSFAYKIHVGALAEHLASCPDGIGDMLDASHAASTESGPIHDQGVELDLAFAIEEAAATGVEGFVVFHDDYGFFDGVKSRAPFFEHTPTGIDCLLHAVQMRFDEFVRNGPRAAVNK